MDVWRGWVGVIRCEGWGREGMGSGWLGWVRDGEGRVGVVWGAQVGVGDRIVVGWKRYGQVRVCCGA